jgi:hypothetical protein
MTMYQPSRFQRLNAAAHKRSRFVQGYHYLRPRWESCSRMTHLLDSVFAEFHPRLLSEEDSALAEYVLADKRGTNQ